MPYAKATVRLDDQLCFALYAAANTVIREYRPLLLAIGLTYPQYLTLMVLWQDDGLAVHEIADRLQLPGNALTPLLARLDKQGYVERTRDAVDGRVVRVRLTPLGADLEHKAAAAQRHVVSRTRLDALSLASFRTQLHDLIHDMRATAACDSSLKGEAT